MRLQYGMSDKNLHFARKVSSGRRGGSSPNKAIEIPTHPEERHVPANVQAPVALLLYFSSFVRLERMSSLADALIPPETYNDVKEEKHEASHSPAADLFGDDVEMQPKSEGEGGKDEDEQDEPMEDLFGEDNEVTASRDERYVYLAQGGL